MKLPGTCPRNNSRPEKVAGGGTVCKLDANGFVGVPPPLVLLQPDARATHENNNTAENLWVIISVKGISVGKCQLVEANGSDFRGFSPECFGTVALLILKIGIGDFNAKHAKFR